MDLTNIFLNLSEVNEVAFEETLLKRIKNDEYYVIDFILNKKHSTWKAEIYKVKSKSSDIPKRVKLYDQPSASSIGVSFSIRSFIGKKKILKIIDNIYQIGYKDEIVGLKEAIDNGTCIYPDDLEEAKNIWVEVNKGLIGYATLAINGKYIVDNHNYDKLIINELYKEMKSNIAEDDFCYLCGTDENLIHGGVKEPAWKFLSTTRTTDLSNDKKAFVRCMSCEIKIMKGINLIQDLSKYEYTKSSQFEKLIIPLTKDKRLWEQIKKLRDEYSSDLDYYQSLERLYERFERRGIDTFLDIRILRNQRSYAVLDTTVVGMDEIRRLRFKESFEKYLWNSGYYINGKSLNFYPIKLLESDLDYKWKYVDRIKKYWLGIETNNSVWEEVEKFLNVDKGIFSIYSLWDDYIKLGEEALDDRILNSKNYALGTIMRIAIKLQEKEFKSDRGKGITSIQKRFMGYPKNIQYAFEEIMKVIEYKKRYLNSSEREELEISLEKYVTAEYSGDKSYYYLALYKNSRKLEGK